MLTARPGQCSPRSRSWADPARLLRATTSTWRSRSIMRPGR